MGGWYQDAPPKVRSVPAVVGIVAVERAFESGGALVD